MGVILAADALSKKKKDSTSTPATGGGSGDIKLHTAEELLASHRAAQGFGPAPGSSTAETPPTDVPSGPSDDTAPPGGMVQFADDDRDNVMNVRRRLMSDGAGIRIN